MIRTDVGDRPSRLGLEGKQGGEGSSERADVEDDEVCVENRHEGHSEEQRDRVAVHRSIEQREQREHRQRHDDEDGSRAGLERRAVTS